MADKDVLLAEYKSLRDEIMKRQDHRLLILAFTITGSGSVIGLTLGKATDIASPVKLLTFALISFVLAVIIAAILLTIQITQQIDVISSYIRKFIEPQLDGMGWEIRWQSYRESKRRSSDSSGLPLGTSKPLAIFYSFLTIAIYSLSYAAGINQNISEIVFLSLLAIVPLGCAYNLYKRKSKGWRIGWEIIDNENEAKK